MRTRFVLNEHSAGRLTTKEFAVGTVHKRADGSSYQKQRDGTWTYYAGPSKKTKAVSLPDTPKKPSALKSALGKAWHTLTEPFVGAFHLATSKKSRSEFKAKIGGALRSEASETKALFSTLKKAVTPGQKVSKEERTAAINQVADLVKAGLIAAMYGSIAAHGIGELLATVASPAEEIIGAALDKPLRAITKKVFGHEHGILPSSFYSKESVIEWVDALEAMIVESENNDPKDLIMRLVDAILDELGSADLDLENALSGISPAQAKKFVSSQSS